VALQQTVQPSLEENFSLFLIVPKFLIIMDNYQLLMGYVGAFIAVAIMLGIGTLILGGAATDCSTITGYNATAGATQTGWSLQCETNNTQSQAGYNLLIIT
jgi:hypothetical protein